MAATRLLHHPRAPQRAAYHQACSRDVGKLFGGAWDALVSSEGRQHCAAVLPTSMAGVPLLLASHFRAH